MKKIHLFSTTVLLTIGLNSFTFAQSPSAMTNDTTASPTTTAPVDTTSTAAAPSKVDKSAAKKSCKNIAIACENAGYRISNQVAGKNIKKDCLKPILGGQTISGVTVDASDVQACQAFKTSMKGKHK